jgi:hypothetical protein
MNSTARLLFAVGLMSASALVSHARIERTVEKNFNVAGVGTLRVETHGGEIRVAPSSDSVVRITARQRINANSEAEADELLQKLELTFDQSGSDVRVVSKYEKRPSGFRFGSWPPVQVDIVVTVPAGFATELNTSGGAITVGDLKGRADVRTSGGSIRLGKMGGEVEARTSGGNITVGRVAGSADLSTSGGNISIESVVSALRADTSGGNIRAKVVGPLKDDCLLSTSGGSVRVGVDKTAAFKLEASTSGGDVDADGLTLTVESSNRNRSKLAGTVNGGGPLLKLRSSGGGIVLRAN